MKPRLDPRCKLILALCLATLALAVADLYYLLFTGLLSLILAAAFGVKLLRLAKRLRHILILLLTISLVQSIFTPDTHVLVNIAGVNLVTQKGLALGVRTFTRMLVIFSSASVMTTSSYRETVQGLTQWKVPYVLAFMTSVAMRFIPVFAEEMRDSLTALQLRGVDIKKIPLGRKMKVYVYLFSPVIADVMKRSQNLAMAMEARGFGAYPSRVSYLVLKMRGRDYVFISLTLALSGAYLAASHLFPFAVI